MQWGGHNYFLSWREPWHKFEDWDWFNGRNFCRDRCMDLVSFDTPGEHKLFTAIARQGQPCFHGIFLEYFFFSGDKVEIILEQRQVGFLSPSKICENLNFPTEIQIFANATYLCSKNISTLTKTHLQIQVPSGGQTIVQPPQTQTVHIPGLGAVQIMNAMPLAQNATQFATPQNATQQIVNAAPQFAAAAANTQSQQVIIWIKQKRFKKIAFIWSHHLHLQ